MQVSSEVWPLRQAFTISRGSKNAAHVVVVTLSDGTFTGRGEAVPYARYGETVEDVVAQLSNAALQGIARSDLPSIFDPGAALNALDCAFWDLEAKRRATRVSVLSGLGEPAPSVTAFTLSLDAPQVMAANAASARHLPLLKLKLGGDGDDARMRAVRASRPDARLIVDANESWTLESLPSLMNAAKDCGVEVIEQPLAAGSDEALRGLPRSVPVCADESVHTVRDLSKLEGLYDAVNVKLDKAGGLTGAIALVEGAKRRGLKIMIGSMVSTSLGVAPAMLLAPSADWLDLDGPLLLARDRNPALRIENGRIFPPPAELWG